MKFNEKKFSVAVGSDDYRKNFDNTFKPTPPCTCAAWDERHLADCPLHDKAQEREPKP